MKENLKEKLKFIVLNKDYDLMIYKILDNNSLDFFLKEMKNTPNFDDPKNLEQLIKLLDRFLFILKREFIGGLVYQEIIIEEIIIANHEKMKKYLSLKCQVDPNQYNVFLLNKIYEIITCNFIKNLKYLPNLQELFLKSKINLEIDLKKIKNLLIDIINCNQKEYHSLYLFRDLQFVIHSQINKNKNLNETIIEKQVIQDFNFRYSLLLESYYSKRKYLKYLVQ